MRYFFSLTLCICSLMAYAQNLKFGKPSQEEWDFTTYAEMPEAEAIVLCKTLDVEYELSGSFEQYNSGTSELTMDNYHTVGINHLIEEGNTAMNYYVKLRIKVLKDSGTRFTDLDIVYFDNEADNDWFDDFNNVSIVHFERINGKVKKHKYDKAITSTERIDPNYCVRHVRVPNVKAGDIVEYQYNLFSRRVNYLYDWQLQEQDLPIVYSKCHMEIPVFLSYQIQTPLHPNVKRKVEQGQVFLPQTSGNFEAPKRIVTNCYTIEATDILPRAYYEQKEDAGENFPAQVSGKGKLHLIHSAMNVAQAKTPAAMPEGKHHLMLDPQ